MPVEQHCFVTAGVALVGAHVIAVAPIAASPPGVWISGIQLAADQEPTDVVIDILRHGERMPPFNQLQIPSPPYPGPPLSDLGEQQARDVGQFLFNKFGPIAGIFSGQGIRDQETAAPFADLEHMGDQVQILPGINEIDFGIYGLKPLTSFGGILSQLHVLLWAAGFPLVAMPGSGQDPNGVIFNEKFTDAVNTMYSYAIDHPVISDTGNITDVAFNNEGSVAVWVESNVKNPDFPFFLVRGIQSLIDPDEHGILPPTGIVEIKGNPEDGWMLVSWDGHDVPQDPGLLTSLLVDVRNLTVAPQTALWHIWDAILGGDPTTIQNAVEAGIQHVSATLLQFPGSVFDDVTHALANPASMFGDITDALTYLADTSGQSGGMASEALNDVVPTLF